MKHELKIWPQYYEAVADGSKTFEIRKNDRGFQKGDKVTLKEYNPDWVGLEMDKYTGKKVKFTIGYVLPIDAERVVFSLLPYNYQSAAGGAVEGEK